MSYDALVIAAHADDAETQMGGTLAKLSDGGQRILLVDLTDGEPTEFAVPGVRAKQALEAARILGVERRNLGLRDRLLQDTPETRLELARLMRIHRPRWVYDWRSVRASRPRGNRQPHSRGRVSGATGPVGPRARCRGARRPGAVDCGAAAPSARLEHGSKRSRVVHRDGAFNRMATV